MKVVLTEHAIERARQRLGWNERALRRMIERVFAFGLGRHQTVGSLRRYLTEHQGKDSIVRTYGEHLYVFRRVTDPSTLYLVTVWHLPRELRVPVRRAVMRALAA